MKENKLKIKINKQVSEVWDFTVDPKNTPKWIESCEKEEANPWPPQVGSIYTNTSKDGQVFKFKMTEIAPLDHFSMLGEDNNYHCRYSYTDLGNSQTELEYYEWMENGELDSPFPQSYLDKLKRVLEA